MSHDSCCGPKFPVSAPAAAVLLSAADVLRIREDTSKSDDEVWHLATIRLPCWALPSPQDAANGAHPVQPVCTFLIRLAPTGALLTKRSSTGGRPDTLPAARDLVEMLRDWMTASGKRPAVVEFSDAGEAGMCKRSLESLGVRTAVVPPHPGLLNYAKEFAQKCAMPREGGLPPIAHITNQNLEPGLRSGGGGAGMTDALVRAFYKQADSLAMARPWENVAERQTLRFRLNDSSEPLWAAIIGQEWIMMQDRLRRAGKDPRAAGPPKIGLVVFRKRADAEGRLMMPLAIAAKREAEEAARTSGAPPPTDPVACPAAVANALDKVCGSCGKSGADSRCSGCADVYYCGEACQREARAAHVSACKSSPYERPKTGTPWAPSRGELLILFVDPLRFPFADHDDIRNLHTPPHAPMMYPLALSFKGSASNPAPSRPTSDELKVLIRALATAEVFVREHTEQAVTPIPMTAEAKVSLGRSSGDATVLRAGSEEVTADAAHWWDATGDSDSNGGPPLVSVRTDPLVTLEEFKAFAARKVQHGQTLENQAKFFAATIVGASAALNAPVPSDAEDEKTECSYLCCRRSKGKGKKE